MHLWCFVGELSLLLQETKNDFNSISYTNNTGGTDTFYGK